MPLDEYKAKRDFRKTPEPKGGPGAGPGRPIFVVQEHHATHLHYDFRLESDGVLKSWSVPKGPSLDPAVKRLAVQVEDHPLAYAGFEGTIPAGQYGAGTVAIWDRGTYENLTPGKTVAEALAAGKLEFALHGQKLRGKFTLVRMRRESRGKPQWLLIKSKDEFASRSADNRDAPSRRQAPRRTRPTAPSRAVRQTPAPKEGVELTHPERVLFPEAGLTKGDVFAYYQRVADRLIPFLRDRPITIERLPEGLAGARPPHFWQKDTPDYYPDWIARVELVNERGRPVRYALVNDTPTLLYLVNQGGLTFHVWASRVADLDRPDFVLFDLDPGQAPFEAVVAIAKALQHRLAAEGREAYLKTSGKTGLHVLVPWTGSGGYDEARAWALERARHIVAELPDRATVEHRKAKRGQRVYIDVLQNARGHHAVPPYVLRAIPRATVSTPLRWSELDAALNPAEFTTTRVLRRLGRLAHDPFEGLLASWQDDTQAKATPRLEL